MTHKKNRTFILMFLAFFIMPAAGAFGAETRQPNSSGYTAIEVGSGLKNNTLKIHLSRSQSLERHWRPGQKVRIQLYVLDPNGVPRYVRDRQCQRAWTAVITGNLEATLYISPASNNYTGRLVILADGEILRGPSHAFSEGGGHTLEKVYHRQFDDGASLKVHYTDQILGETGGQEAFVRQVLDAAIIAYRTIVHLQGFSTQGYSFANPDKRYAYDPDRTIDIYLGNPVVSNAYNFHTFTNQSFLDSPCFDTVKLSGRAYQAVILIPANYKEFIKNWERLNPSSLGDRDTGSDIRGTLIHEMLHVILFYYNKNLNQEIGPAVHPDGSQKAAGAHHKNLDWYVEGLARYFETFAGARSDFFSQGFRETLADKIRFSRGGSNYFMRYPDQPFTELRYENALFWRFIDYQFGIQAIEKLSREFRSFSEENFSRSLESATGTSMRELLKRFALAGLHKDFGLKDDTKYLKDVARTRLLFKNGAFYMLDGYENEKHLGTSCKTDWVGSWDSARAKYGELPVGGDNTEGSDVSGWATDFYEVAFDGTPPRLPVLRVLRKGDGGEGLGIQLVLRTTGGSSLVKYWDELPDTVPQSINIESIAAKEGFAPEDIDSMYLLITNYDAHKNTDYEIISS